MDYKTIYQSMTTPRLISEAWTKETDPKLRDRIVTLLRQRELQGGEDGGDAAWPSGPMADREKMAGLYPDPADPQFAARLYAKREFHQARAVAARVAEGEIDDPCSNADAEKLFELTPVQRLVTRFMHPLTPYMGLLLFHGVGVGKTCSAVTIAEQFLEVAPHLKVIVLVPQALQENFKRTIFDPTKIKWVTEEGGGGHWESRQCTGTSYLERLGLEETPDIKTVAYKVDEDRRARYTIRGYQSFANLIRNTLESSVPAGLTDPELRRQAEDEILRRMFSEHLIIVDEAHNLRDSAMDGVAEEAEDAATPNESNENAGGKALNPYLRRIVLNAEGLRIVFMTATPMYNSAPEIILLLNYLAMNDTKNPASALKVADVFSKDGDLKPGRTQVMIERLARRYVSYMRGENPYTFPIRVRPADAVPSSSLWPTVSATKKDVAMTEDEAAALDALPLVLTEPIPDSPPEVSLRGATRQAVQREEGAEAGSAMLDLRMQMANITYPNMLYGTAGWDTAFSRSFIQGAGRKLRVFSYKEGDIDSVFAGEGLRRHAPKIHRVVQNLTTAQGICFAYSRYIKAGALPLAVALERAGFQRRMADGSLVPVLSGTIRPPPPICAICGKREAEGHTDHPFRPACYVLLTSEDDISPQFSGLVRQAASWPDDPEWGPVGGRVKVIIGSQVASEGLDLKCVREMHVIDAWYHLNRTDQIIGRAIRYCSHTALRAIEKRRELPAMSMNNCLIYLHALLVGGQDGFETADMYAYRLAIGKAQMVGKVQRLLKKHAWDCNLELEAITFAGLPNRFQIDAQGREMTEYSVDDQDYTTYCDYQICKHTCAVAVPRNEEDGLEIDSSTFRVADARRTILEKQDVVRRLFEDQVMMPETVVQDIFSDLPWEIASEALMELLDGRRFKVTHQGIPGCLIKKAGFLVFQPAAVTDTEIPLTLRYARAFQLRRRFMEPQMPVFARAEEPGALKGITERAPVLAPPPAKTSVNEIVKKVEGPAVFQRWKEWYAFVNGKSPMPKEIPAMYGIWSWILDRFGGVPEVRGIALRWWFDKLLDYDVQVSLLKYAAGAQVEGSVAVGGGAGDETKEALNETLATNIMRAKQVTAYRIYNPNTMNLEFWCKPNADPAKDFSPCNSAVAAIVDKALNNIPIPIPAGTGPLFGFLAAKKGRVVFKTLDITKPKKSSTVGAECGNTSNLGEHHPRIRTLHAAARLDPVLGSLVLPDDDESWAETGTKDKGKPHTPKHMKDITHQPLCLYMEFLTRVLDAREVGKRRWFLSAVEASQAGLKGRA